MLIGRYSLDDAVVFATPDPVDGSLHEVTDPFRGAPQPTGRVVDARTARLFAPCEPAVIVAAAVNYASHAIKRSPTDKPELFFKPSSSVVGPEEEIVLPSDAGTVEAEGELVAVIGRRAKEVRVEDALDHVLGYTCGVDVSARDWQRADRQFWRAKGCDTFSPIGPLIATELDLETAELATRVDGVQQQFTSVSDLLFGVSELVAFASHHITLRPGDAIFTGTPGRTPAIAPGQLVEVSISGIGTLRNPVTSARTVARQSS